MSTRVLILAGGQSEEHTVSLTSARCVLRALHEVPSLVPTVRVLTRTGGILDEAASLAAIAQGDVARGGASLAELFSALADCDVVLPLTHGPMGEDGTLQGLLELAQVPYVGCGVLGSALCMDKPMAKQVLAAAQLPQVAFITLNAADYAHGPAACVDQVQKSLRAPWFVKPANMGSSVGISQAHDAETLRKAIATALTFDRRIIIEEGLTQVRELEVGVLGNDTPEASPVGEICHDGSFYDYATKYTAGHSNMVIPAKVPSDVQDRIRDLARQTYRLLDCAGLARIDFFYTPQDGAIYINEINTLPGFTDLSMFPSLWAAADLAYGPLLERLVALAQERHANRG
jgi:D-alanine-D-alanine ligase